MCSRSSRRDRPKLIISTLHRCSAFSLTELRLSRETEPTGDSIEGEGKEGKKEKEGRRGWGIRRENKKLSHMIIEAAKPPFMVGEL